MCRFLATSLIAAGLWGASALAEPVRAEDWRPLELLTPPARPAPVEGADLDMLVRKVSNKGLPASERAAAAKRLAGVADERAISALISGLSQPPPDNEERRFRSVCADALKWQAAAGNERVLAALLDALLDSNTSARDGAAIVKSILDAKGAPEFLRILKGWLLEERGTQTVAIRGRGPFLAWLWALTESMGACHFGPQTSYAEAMREFNGELGEALRRMSPDRMERMVSSEWWLDLVGELVQAPGGQAVARGLFAGLPNRTAMTQRLVSEWTTRGPVTFSSASFYARLDEPCLRGLWEVRGRLPRDLAEKVKDLVVTLCHGEAEAVLSGRKKFADAIMRRIESVAPLDVDPHCLEAPDRKSSDRRTVLINPWLQLALLPVQAGKGKSHPCARIMLDGARPLPERAFAAGMLALSVADGGVQEAHELVPAIERLLEDGTGGDTAPEMALYAAGVSLLLYASRHEERCDRFFSALRLGKSPMHEAIVLSKHAAWAYKWMDVGGPARMASEVVSCLEAAYESKNSIRGRVGALLSIALRHLTPEVLPPMSRGWPDVGAETDPWNEEVLAAWRAWLERFKRLPVFANAAHN